ncbi:hypothetical protein D1007_36985 [Hordeum vulgare]|nr:hypothetical protein D1007_36985 [Hordeum vulgare]
MVLVDAKRHFASIVKIDLSTVYTNKSVIVEKFINTLDQLLAEDNKYKVVNFDLEYTDDHAGHNQMVVVAQLCLRHYVLVYHYCMATSPCEHFARFVNNPDYKITMVDTTNDLKVLKTSGLSCEKVVNIHGQYTVWGGMEKKQKDSLFDLAATMIDPYYRDMKYVCGKENSVYH